ncbi:hypothetical protein U6L75_07755 [Cutibacterium acnes]|nr:hypothetical protein PAST3_07259 [Cutibacterium acnes HL201PA1]KPG64483.1 hypothetical protein AK827_09730 [Cutibacterium acnes]KPG67166.1 hypothetical protein AK828_03030 [Cutibacterium acnes]PZA01756.1 hypothetical protein Asn12ST33_03355 [Cutibacterium acnes]WGH36400.1 hypothetical protein OYC58_002178 [Cutibacterium acnes]
MTEQSTHPKPRHAEPGDVSPSAPPRASAETIATLPPPEVPEAQAASSAKVGRIAAGLYLTAAVAAAAALLIAWWQSIHMQTFIQATNLMTWTHPRPGSLASVLLATAMMSIAAAMVAMPGILAVNTWLGRRWVRWGAIGGVAVGCAAVTLNWVSWIGMPFLIAAGVMVWLPPVRRWMDSLRPVTHEAERPTFPVRYGRVPQHY